MWLLNKKKPTQSDAENLVSICIHTTKTYSIAFLPSVGLIPPAYQMPFSATFHQKPKPGDWPKTSLRCLVGLIIKANKESNMSFHSSRRSQGHDAIARELLRLRVAPSSRDYGRPFVLLSRCTHFYCRYKGSPGAPSYWQSQCCNNFGAPTTRRVINHQRENLSFGSRWCLHHSD